MRFSAASISDTCWRVLVAAPRQGDEDRGSGRNAIPGFPSKPPDRMRRLEGRHDAFGDRKQLESGDRFVVGRRLVLGAAGRGERRVLGTDARIVEARR